MTVEVDEPKKAYQYFRVLYLRACRTSKILGCGTGDLTECTDLKLPGGSQGIQNFRVRSPLSLFT